MAAPIKGRGATGRPASRFETREIRLAPEIAAERDGERPETVLKPMPARSIVSYNDSPDIPFERSINPYQGCEHGCVYCYARPTHGYLDLSPGLDFETRIFYKPNAVERLLATWEKPGYECAPITLGANTDPYQPAEKRLQITRQLLETFLKHRHPVSLITKGTLIERDLDLLGALAAEGLASVAVSVPTLDRELKRKLEPRVPAATARLAVIAKLREVGVPVTVLVAPVIPALNDREIETIIEHAAAAGAERAAWILLRLPHEVREIFADWLEAHYPDREAHVLSLMRQAHGGREYDSRFGHRQRGRGPYAAMLASRFKAACARHGIIAREAPDALDCSRFVKPGAQQFGFNFGAP